MTATTAAPLSVNTQLTATGFSSPRWMLVLNVIGGAAVLGSYAWGFAAGPELTAALWGGVPESLRPLYQNNMLLAAGGYLVFTGFLYFSRSLEPWRKSGGLARTNLFYCLVLIPSALWLPLTALMIDAPGAAIWGLIRLDLLLVGTGAVGLLVSLVKMEAPNSWARIAAIAGALPFVLQTAILDAFVWPAYYPQPTF